MLLCEMCYYESVKVIWLNAMTQSSYNNLIPCVKKLLKRNIIMINTG
jgi:hypothetical protein